MGIFVLFYYKQVLGLSGTLTGVALAIAIAWDGITDPLVGAWSDRVRSRWGRRHPFMLAAVVPMALGFYALFVPIPSVMDTQTGLFCWLLGSLLLLRTALTGFMVPFLAMGAEITSDYHERSHLAGLRTNLGYALGVAVAAGSLWMVFTTAEGVDGRFIVGNYHVYGFMCAVLVLVGSTVCIASTWQYIPRLSQPAEDTGGSFFMDLREAFANRNFRYVFLFDTALGGISGVTAALLMVSYTYFWELETEQISLLFAVPTIIAVVVISLGGGHVHRLLEKQQILRVCCLVTGLNFAWLTPMKLLGLLPEATSFVFLLVLFNYTVYLICTVMRQVANQSLLADIADENELATGKRQEGVMFASAFFAAKFVSGFGYLFAGPFLDLIGLEAGMAPGDAPRNVVLGLGLMMGPGLAVFMILPLWLSTKMDLSREGFEKVQFALREKENGLLVAR